MFKYLTLKPIMVDRLGRVPAGQVVELTKAQGNIYEAQGAVERYQTKVIEQSPMIKNEPLTEEVKPAKKQAKKKPIEKA